MIIRIKNLRLRALIGVTEQERSERQEVLVHIEVDLGDSPAARSDRIEDTLDYADLKEKVLRLVEGREYRLLERLAGEVLGVVMSYPPVRAATVEAEKPGALRLCDSVSVTCSARRPG